MNTGQNKNNKSNQYNNSNSPAAVSASLLLDMAEAGRVMDGLFNNLQSETGNFVGSLVSGFHLVSGFLDEVLKMFGSFAKGSDSGIFSLFSGILSFLPGGGLLSGLFDLFSGFGSSIHAPSASGTNEGIGNFLRQPDSNNITVVVNSEIESSKAVKFLTNYMPVYNTRTSGSVI